MKKWSVGICYFLILLHSACTYDQLSVVAECDNNLLLRVSERTAPACGVASGSVKIAVDGQAAGLPVTFTINGTEADTVSSFTNLLAGSYVITARQGVCEETITVILENDEGLKASAESTPSNCSSASGTITVTTADATGAVSFILDGTLEQSEPTFTGLTPGSYQVTAQDTIGCAVTLEVVIPSDVGFDQIKSLVTASCAVSGCHAGNVSPDFRVDNNILSRAQRIGARTGNGTMPPPSSGRSLTQSEIDAIRCWIDDGASN